MVRRLLIIGGSVALLLALLAYGFLAGLSGSPCAILRCRRWSDMSRPACKVP